MVVPYVWRIHGDGVVDMLCLWDDEDYFVIILDLTTIY